MANVQVHMFQFTDELPGHGHLYFYLWHPSFYNAAVSVTAFAVYPPERYLQITQVVTNSDIRDTRYLHCVVQNTGPVDIGGFRVYVGVISP